MIGCQLGVGATDDGHADSGIPKRQQLCLGANGEGLAAAPRPTEGNVLVVRCEKELLLFRGRGKNEMRHTVSFRVIVGDHLLISAVSPSKDTVSAAPPLSLPSESERSCSS